MSWQGQFGDLIESLEFYETDEKRGFVRGARWGLAPTGGPINAALPAPRRRADLGPGPPPARQGGPGPRRELGPVRRGPARRGQPHHAVDDGHRRRRHPGAGGPLHDGRQRAPHARLPHRAGEGVDGRGRRVQDRGRPADALLRLAPAGHGAHGRRPEDVRARSLEPGPRRAEPVRRRRLVLRHVESASTRLRRSSRSPCAPPTTWSRRASTSRCRHDRRRSRRDAGPTTRAARRFAAVADHLIPAAHGMPSAAEVVNDERIEFVLRARPDLAEPLQRSAPRRIWATMSRLGWTRSARTSRPTSARCSSTIVAGYYTDKRRARADRLPGPDGDRGQVVAACPSTSKRATSTRCSRAARCGATRAPARAPMATNVPTHIRERFTEPADSAEGGSDGRDSA